MEQMKKGLSTRDKALLLVVAIPYLKMNFREEG